MEFHTRDRWITHVSRSTVCKNYYLEHVPAMDPHRAEALDQQSLATSTKANKAMGHSIAYTDCCKCFRYVGPRPVEYNRVARQRKHDVHLLDPSLLSAV